MTRGEKVIAFIEKYCRVPQGEHVSQPLKLAQFQRDFITSVYDNPSGTRRAFLSIARKNGKTGLIAGILLAHLVGPEAKKNSQIVSGAMSREQAALVFDLATQMINMNETLSRNIKIIPSSKRLIGLPMNVQYKALAAEGRTSHGLSPVLAILDEVGQVRGPRDDFITAITTSQGAHKDPLLIAISTQAATDADLFSVWLDDAERSKDPRIVSHVYAAPEGADVLDRSAWQAANPALGIFRSVDDMEQLAKEADRMPSSANDFRNYNLNQRVSPTAPFVSVSVWEACGGDPGHMEGIEVYAGLDLSGKTDLTSVVFTAEEDGLLRVWPFFWTPEEGLQDRVDRDRQPYDVWVDQGYLRTTPGRTVDYEFVITDLMEIIGDNELLMMAFDRWRIDIFKRDCDRIGVELPLKEFGQGFRDMGPAIDKLEEYLLNERMQHGMHPVLTMCAANAVVTKDPAGSRKLDKSKATGRIDGMVALAMAIGAMEGNPFEDDDLDDFISNPIIV